MIDRAKVTASSSVTAIWHRATVITACLPLLLRATPGSAHQDDLRITAGPARCTVGPVWAALENDALGIELSDAGGQLHWRQFDNRLASTHQAPGGELFSLQLRDGRSIRASDMQLEGEVHCAPLAANAGAARAAARYAGQSLHALLRDATSGLSVDWRLELRDSGLYVRQEVRLAATRELDLAAVTMVDLDLDGATVAGTVDGSPIVTMDGFYGFEHPMAVASVLSGRARMELRRVLPLRADTGVAYSSVIGVAPRGQLRRAFMDYLERERVHPFRTFLHYNSWYDIGYFTPYTQDDALHVIEAYGQQLVRARGVRMDSFLFDDGWDDTSRLWQFSDAFPHGFAPLREAAARYGAAPGIWLSPWGGYGPPRKARLQAARNTGYEVDDQGLALSGPKYYTLFHRTALELLRNYGINHFKLDGTGSANKVTPGSEFDSDFAAAIALIDDLRRAQPDLFINLTTGTWPSPFWLRTADSIWRGGEDHGFLGAGSNRQRWMTYRDADAYGGIVRRGFLFPLNSVMLHGIIYARHAQGLSTDPGNDFADEAWSYFASGTGLQELYISPDLLTPVNWDQLAAAARWARDRADTLRDSHWIGGDPARAEVYGWASWSAQRAVIALRNPAAVKQALQLDLAATLELPRGAARRWRVTTPRTTPRSGGEPRHWSADTAVSLELKPFEVQLWELRPE